MSLVHVVKSSETVSLDIKSKLFPEYRSNMDSFYKWRKNHRIHQTKAINATAFADIGQISLPTGTGKTRVQVDIHVEAMWNSIQTGRYGVYVIASHRLALNHQLLNELVEVVVNSGLPFDLLFVGADQFTGDSIITKFKNKGLSKAVMNAKSALSQDEILKAYTIANESRRHLIVVSTYHSFDRLKVLPKIDVCTFDEAHSLIGNSILDNQLLQNVIEVKPIIARQYFFTATRKVQGNDGGMNRTDIFGNVIAEVSPRQMIDESEIVPPKLHIIDTTEEGDYTNHTMLVKTTIIGFEQHKALVKECSADPDSIGAKLLISTTGNKEMFELHDDPAFKDHCRKNNIHVFAFSASEGAFVNFEAKDRQEAMRMMQSLPDNADAILLHIEILTEGIDLPSITGVMPFRELNLVKLLQTIGRASRLFKEDRLALYGGRIQPKQYDRFIKPFCWVLIPRFFKSLGDSKQMTDMLKTIINSYEVPVEEYSTIDRYVSESDSENDRITKHDKPTKKERESDLTHIIEDILVEKVNTALVDKCPLSEIDRIFTSFLNIPN